MRQYPIVMLLAFALLLGAASTAHGGSQGRVDMEMLHTPIYSPEGQAIVRHNGDRFNNRPLYCNQISAIVVAGDRPLIRFGSGSVLNGTFMAALVRGDRAKWLHDWSDITSKYRPDRMEWTLRDDTFGPTVLALEVVPPAEGAGMALRLRIENAQAGDRLIWTFGGAVQQKESMLGAWDVTTGGREKMLKRGFSPEDCRDNRVILEGERLMVQPSGNATSAVVGQCSVASKITIADAAAWPDPLRLSASSAKDVPLACAAVNLDGQREICWAMLGFRGNPLRPPSPAEVFAAGLKRAEEIGSQVIVDTPDPRLNALVAASNAVIDGVYREGIFTHSGMRWGVSLLGWRSIFGGTAYGWHDRVKNEARLCLAKQITESDKKLPKADPKTGLSCQSLESRMFGRGRVNAFNTWHYDMQSIFFDQLIHAWRWTGDPELEKLLRPALDLHLDYIRECFDPDDDGLYEAYATTWPTDNQWYNGGGTAEETAYAYAGHKAALELARRAGDDAAAKRHEARLARIHKAFMEKLWIPSKGYVGSYVEQGGHQRLHEDSWLYAIFCPIDAGMLNANQAASALYYTEWGLERENMPYGGQRCWTSNWVPSVWSLREMWPGDNYHLALADFQAGLADDGWNVLRGTFPHMAYYGPVPGDLGHAAGGTDFNDCASMFCRTVVEGLFGYRPDYPNGVVTIAPQLPSDWDHASIKTPDFSLAIRDARYQIELTKPAALDLRLPVRVRKLAKVTVNGEESKSELLPGVGCSVAKIAVPKCRSAIVELTCEGPLPQYAAVTMEGNVGDKLDLLPKDASIIEPAVPPVDAGYRMVESLVQVGNAPQRRMFKIKLHDPKAEATAAARVFEKPPADARWECLDLSRQLNGDVRTMFQQQYLSPRPATCSLRLATDGYSTWQMMLDPRHKPPTIDLANVPKLLDPASRLLTPQGVPFAWISGQRNIAFTSMWDNWPRRVSVPVNRKAEGIWMLVCGFTNPMQGRIANAELRLKYADGVVEKLELVPPLNFWSLCPFGRVDYDYKRDFFCLPKTPPPTVQLGSNCRANLLNLRLRPD
ncbi:MAG: DUF4450 domain-containing protein, partial [Tepidisphaeraceae bacterium]